MKKLTLYSIVFLFIGNAHLLAQDVLDKITDETCVCINERLPEGTTDATQIEMVLGLCMIEAAGKNSAALKAETGIEVDGVESIEKLGETIGERLATRCDRMMELIFVLMGDENSETSQAIREELDATSAMSSTTGKVTFIGGEEMLKLKIQTGGTEETYVFLGEFEGLGVVKLGKDLVGKKVAIEYVTTTIYSPKLKTWVEMNEVRLIELE